MKQQSKYIGRMLFFKYIAITFVILCGMLLLSLIVSPELNIYFQRNLITYFLNNTIYFSYLIFINLIIIYIISGKIGIVILDKNKSIFDTIFIGFIKIWLGIFITVMSFDMIPRIFKYGTSFSTIPFILFTLLINCLYFIIIGGIQGGLTTWFIAKEIEIKKNNTAN